MIAALDARYTVTAPPPRRGLRESLERYASRTGMRVHDARPFWRAEALRLLNVAACTTCRDTGRVRDPLGSDSCNDCEGRGADVSSGLCACAPGVAIPTAFVDWPDDWPPSGGAT